MLTIAYLANIFPSPVEPYVSDEIAELRRRGVTVLPCSVLQPAGSSTKPRPNLLYLWPSGAGSIAATTWLWIGQFWKLRRLWLEVLRGREPLIRKLKTLPHAWLGARLALGLRCHRVNHIHVHHGYFSSWVAMIAAHLLDATFSVTLHGSDLLLHDAYLDLKLRQCAFCVTISEFNRNYILERFPQISAEKILVQRMGVDCPPPHPDARAKPPGSTFKLLAVGRLQPVKNHALLIRACRLLKDRGVPISCSLAGDGPERNRLAHLTRDLNLENEVQLLGHLQPAELNRFYQKADLIVLTSISEGIPLVLMEAMARAKPVLAPAITGIPELIADGQNGFLFSPGSLDSLVARIEMIRDTYSALGPLRFAARQTVIDRFDRRKNLAAFCDAFLTQLRQNKVNPRYEDPVLQ
ncbi:MAG TPA: glycosyltransferase family 4 protein [Terriglobales bacterium]